MLNIAVENTKISSLIYNASQEEKTKIAKAILSSALLLAEDVVKQQAQKISYTEADDKYVDTIIGNVNKTFTNKAKAVLSKYEAERNNKMLEVYKDFSTVEAANKIANALKEAVAKSAESFSVDKCVDIAVEIRCALFNDDDQKFLDTFDHYFPDMVLAYYSMMINKKAA